MSNETRYPVGMYVDGISTSGDVKLKVRGHYQDRVIVEVVEGCTFDDVEYKAGEVFVVDALNIIESEFNKGVIEHPPLGTWQAEPNGLAEGDGMFIYTSNDRQQRLTVVTYFGQVDGKPVLEVEGTADFRVNVNDSTIYDRSTEEESRVNIAALAYYRHLTGQEDRHRIDPAVLRAELIDLGFTPDAGRG